MMYLEMTNVTKMTKKSIKTKIYNNKIIIYMKN